MMRHKVSGQKDQWRSTNGAGSTAKHFEDAGQYAGTLGSPRIAEIFAESYKIALSSKNPDTATDRFDLALESYYQFMEMESAVEARAAVQQAMEELVDLFPVQVVANEVLGLREKARKLKTPHKQLELLQRAHEIVTQGLTEHPCSSMLQEVAAQLRVEILRFKLN